MFSGVRPSSGAAGLGAGEIWQSSGVFGVATLLLPRTAALRTLNTYPVGRVRVVLFELRLQSGTCNSKESPTARPQ